MKVMFLACFGFKWNFLAVAVAISWYETHEWFDTIVQLRERNPQYSKICMLLIVVVTIDTSHLSSQSYKWSRFNIFFSVFVIIVFVDWLAFKREREREMNFQIESEAIDNCFIFLWKLTLKAYIAQCGSFSVVTMESWPLFVWTRVCVFFCCDLIDDWFSFRIVMTAHNF